jgi:hypothetical protein
VRSLASSAAQGAHVLVAERRRELRVGARASAPHPVAVHPVVLDEQVALEQLDGHGRRVGRLQRRARRDARVGGDEHPRAEALPPAEGEIPRGLGHLHDVAAVRPQLSERVLEQGGEAGVHLAAHRPEVRAEGLKRRIGLAGSRRHELGAHVTRNCKRNGKRNGSRSEPVRDGRRSRPMLARRGDDACKLAARNLAMATCPSCREHYSDEVATCAKDGSTLVPDAVVAAADTEMRPGEQVGEYRIEVKLGEGGFGAVYRAVHPVIGKTAAVKLLHRQFSSNPQMVSRFIAEAKAVNQIRHKNIIDIFAFGALPDGRQYYVMELLEGMTFDRYIKAARPPQPVEEALPDPPRHRARARRGARRRHRPPRSQAREHLHPVRRGRRRRRRSSSISASRSSSARARSEPQDAHRHADGHAVLHVARAVPSGAPSTTAPTSIRSA